MRVMHEDEQEIAHRALMCLFVNYPSTDGDLPKESLGGGPSAARCRVIVSDPDDVVGNYEVEIRVRRVR